MREGEIGFDGKGFSFLPKNARYQKPNLLFSSSPFLLFFLFGAVGKFLDFADEKLGRDFAGLPADAAPDD